jgi:hypothetical protein
VIYQNATPRDLGLARIVIFGLLLVRLLMDPVQQLADFPFGAFVPHGLLNLIPPDAMQWLLTSNGLLAFKWSYAAVLALCILGLGPRFHIMLVAVLGAIFYDGLTRGFGGHVNHQELIVTHCAILMLFFPCYDGLAVNRLAHFSEAAATPVMLAACRLGLRAVCFWIALTYFYIGVARLQASGLKVYFTNTMVLNAFQHSLRAGYWNFGLGRNLPNEPWLQVFLSISFPLATALEIAAPLAVFVRKLTIPLVVCLLLFHVMIFLFMNLLFWQNIVLLSLLVFGSRPERLGLFPSGRSIGARLNAG